MTTQKFDQTFGLTVVSLSKGREFSFENNEYEYYPYIKMPFAKFVLN